MSEKIEGAAERIAQRGREQLLGHLRPAFQEAAAAHADLLELTPEQLEEMVHKAAERADGLQWRRALASAACEELHIPLSEALDHPAVARAQELVGAPSYEESLAQLAASGQEAPAGAQAEPAGEEKPAAEEEEPVDRESEPAAEEDDAVIERDDDDAGHRPPDPGPHDELEPAEAELHGEPVRDDFAPYAAPPPEDEDDQDQWREDEEGEHDADDEDWEEDYLPSLRIPVIHIGGIANLGPAEGGIELLLAEPGLDIVRREGEVIGRLEWDQVQTLEVPPPRRRLRRSSGSQLVIRTARGEASFQAPEHSADELREQLSPILELYLSGSG